MCFVCRRGATSSNQLSCYLSGDDCRGSRGSGFGQWQPARQTWKRSPQRQAQRDQSQLAYQDHPPGAQGGPAVQRRLHSHQEVASDRATEEEAPWSAEEDSAVPGGGRDPGAEEQVPQVEAPREAAHPSRRARQKEEGQAGTPTQVSPVPQSCLKACHRHAFTNDNNSRRVGG